MTKPRILVILGQTATGKSGLAVKIALRLRSGPTAKKGGGEIISADSRQVYKGLDIGTGKITKREMMGVPHHLLDIASPKKKFTVVQFKALAEEKIKEILGRGKIPIICGGTGFYIEAVTKGITFPEVPPNYELRKRLARKETTALFRTLEKFDPERAKAMDPRNKVRLIRAIEIAMALGKVPKITKVKPMYKFVKIGLYLPQEKLKDKIRIRLFERIREGMINEARKLHRQGLSWKRMHGLGLEYKYMALYLQDKISKQEMAKKLESEIYQYAKRQMTWFKRDKEIKWFDVSDKRQMAQLRSLILKFFD